MDALEADDRALAAQLSPAQKLTLALEMMSMGIRVKRAALMLRFPQSDPTEIDELLTAWLTQR